MKQNNSHSPITIYTKNKRAFTFVCFIPINKASPKLIFLKLKQLNLLNLNAKLNQAHYTNLNPEVIFEIKKTLKPS